MTESKIIKAETKEKQEHVLQILEEQGYTWQSGNKPTELVPYDFYGKEHIYIYCNDRYKNIYIHCNDHYKILTISTYAKNNNVILYEEFVSRHKKIII